MLVLFFLKFFARCVLKSVVLASVVPLILFLSRASADALPGAFVMIFFTILPWMIWMQYLITISAFVSLHKRFSFFLIAGCMIFSVVLLIAVLPYVPSPRYVNFNKIITKPTLFRQSSVITRFGSLYLEPRDVFPESARALWISSNNLAFAHVETNNNFLVLRQACVLGINGYTPQNAALKISFVEPKSIARNSGYGRKIFLWWLEKTILFSSKINQLAQTLNIFSNKIDQFFPKHSNQLRTAESNGVVFADSVSKSLNYHNTLSTAGQNYINYIVLFLYLCILFLAGSIVCMVLSLGQPLLNVLSLAVLAALIGTFYIPSFFAFVSLLLKLLSFLPLWTGLLLIVSVEALILSIISSLRNKIQGLFYD